MAGATALQIASNTTSLLVMQHKKCACFEIFDAVFGSSPNVKPVWPVEVGGDALPDSQEDMVPDTAPVAAQALAPSPLRASAPAPASVAAPAPVAAPAAPAPAPAPSRAAGGAVKAPSSTVPVTPGKAAAVFHLAPSKKEKKMDLGEAYLKAQQTRTDTQAITAQAKTRCDLVIALTLQGKTAVEIAEFLQVCFS